MLVSLSPGSSTFFVVFLGAFVSASLPHVVCARNELHGGRGLGGEEGGEEGERERVHDEKSR